MYVDAQLKFCEDLAITVTANATNVIDLGVARDIGKSINLWWIFKVGIAFTAAGAATLTLNLGSDDNAIASSVTPLLMMTTEAIGKATLIAGYQRIIKLQPAAYERYLYLQFTVATGPMTAGTLTSFLTREPQDWASYNDAI